MCLLGDDGWIVGDYGFLEYKRFLEEEILKFFFYVDLITKWNL